jgi:poly(3-hydroxybutyrate) depolymerase
MILRNLLLLSPLVIAAPAALSTAGQLDVHPFAHNGYNRPYLVYTPVHLDPHPPVVFVLGGVGSSARSTASDLGWTQQADQHHFLLIFPEPLTRDPQQPFVKFTNTTFWEMQGSRTHALAPGMPPVDDDGYLMAVLADCLHTSRADRKRVFFTGFSSGSAMVQILASRHPKSITAIAAVATPLLEPPQTLARPVPLLYIHGDDDEQFSGFEVNSPNFATSPHGNWVTWGYLDGCHVQRAQKTLWGVQLTWQLCRHNVPVIADFIKGLGHEWLSSDDAPWNATHRPQDPLNFPAMAWQFFASLPAR